MWKDFFYFSKGQRTAIIVLLVLILITILATWSLSLFSPATETDGTEFLKEAELFRKTLVSRDSLRQVAWKERYEKRLRKDYQDFRFEKPEKENYTLFTFDPNTADSATLTRLGLKPFIASNILKYRRKGGYFATNESFGKVFGISPAKFKELNPYISIREKVIAKTDSVKPKGAESRIAVIVELNMADTAELMKVKGIGYGYAKGIVRYRRLLGGFCSIDQLHEIYGMTPENFEKIKPFCTVNKNLIQKININTASVEKLKNHPYLGFYKAKAIYEIRRNRIKLHSLADLKILQELTPDDLKKLEPYLSFD